MEPKKEFFAWLFEVTPTLYSRFNYKVHYRYYADLEDRGNFRPVEEEFELLSNLVYGHPESSGLPARLSLVNPIDELHVGDHAGQMTEAA